MNYNENSGYYDEEEVRDEGEELQQPFSSSDDELGEEDGGSSETPVEYDPKTGKPVIGWHNSHEIEGVLTGDYLPAKRPGPGRPKGRKDSRKFSKRGRPGHEPNDVTRQTVLMHVAVGTTTQDIARLLGVSLRTLKRHYREELNFGKAKANASVAGKLFNRAMNGDTTAQIFWMKASAGWSDKQQVQFSSEDGTTPVNKVEIEVIGDDAKKPKQITAHEPEHPSDSTTS